MGSLCYLYQIKWIFVSIFKMRKQLPSLRMLRTSSLFDLYPVFSQHVVIACVSAERSFDNLNLVRLFPDEVMVCSVKVLSITQRTKPGNLLRTRAALT